MLLNNIPRFAASGFPKGIIFNLMYQIFPPLKLLDIPHIAIVSVFPYDFDYFYSLL